MVKHKEMKLLASAYTMNQWQSWEYHPGGLDSQALAQTTKQTLSNLKTSLVLFLFYIYITDDTEPLKYEWPLAKAPF